MNNDSIIRECAQVVGETSNVFKGQGSMAPVTNVFKNDLSATGPRPPRSSLAGVQLAKARTREEMQRLAEEAWRQRGLALIDPLLINDDFARQALINEANRLYGRTNAAQVQP